MDGGTVFWIVVGVISWGIIILALVNSHKNKDNPDAMKFMVRLLHRLGIDGYPSGQEIVIWGFANKLEVCYRKNKKKLRLMQMILPIYQLFMSGKKKETHKLKMQ